MMLETGLQQASSSGWQAHLELEFSQRIDKTVLAKSMQRGPLRVQRAFYPEGNVCHLYVLHPPGGVVGGDSLTIKATVNEQANALLTTPGATKFYRSQAQTAVQQQHLTVNNDSVLEWLPQENIYFPGAEVNMATKINLAETARFIGWETHCFGLPANDESFTSGRVNFSFSLYKANRPVILERLLINQTRLNAPTSLRGHPVMSMMVATPADNNALEIARNILSKHTEHVIAATLIEDCLLIRYIGDSTEHSRRIFTQLWMALRPEIIGRKACPPRIWAT